MLKSKAVILAVWMLAMTGPAWAATTSISLAAQAWIPTWYASPEPTDKTAVIHDQTLRQIVRVSAGGDQVRLRLSNAYGTEPLRLDAIRIAQRLNGSRIDPASSRAATFNGQTGVTIPPGAYVLSDPLPFAVAADSDLAVSLYVAGETRITTLHDIQRGALYAAPGQAVDAAELPMTKPDLGIGNAFPWLSEVEVSGGPATGTVITFGDSITDGYGIDRDRGATWPETLSRRFHEAGLPLSVINAGISGNRLLHHGQWVTFGDGGLARFDRDVLAQPNVAAVIFLIGINDLGHAAGPGSPGYVSAADLIDGLSQATARAREHGLHVYAATLTPFRDTVFSGYYSDEKEGRRQAVNAWIRSTTIFDGVIDFDKALEAPDAPGHLLPAYDLGDHLHPNTAGAGVMANAVPLGLFTWARPANRPAKPRSKRQ